MKAVSMRVFLFLYCFFNLVFANQTHFKVAIDQNYMPFSYQDKQGNAQGLYVDLWKIWASKNNYTVEFISSDWLNSVKKVQNGEADFHMSLYAKEKDLHLSRKIHATSVSLFVLESSKWSNDISSYERVGVIDPIFGKMLQEQFPTIQVVVEENYASLIPKVLSKELDGLFDTKLAVQQELIKRHQLHQFKISELNYEIKIDAQPASANKKLIKVFNEGWRNVSLATLQKIESRWIYNDKNRFFKQENKLRLTKEELAWIEANPEINVGVESDWAPFDFVNEHGNYAGFANDYMDYVSKVTGLRFNIQVGESWDELLQGLKKGEIDLLPAIYFSKEREAFANFTTPYLSISDYFITKYEVPQINSIDELYGKKVVSIKGFEVTQWLKQNHPSIKLIEVDTLLEALRRVESGTAEAFINDNPSATYTSQQNFISDLKLNNIVKNRSPISLHMATKKEYRLLSQIISKSINSISLEERKTIAKKWMSEVSEVKKELNLSAKEMEWLSKKNVLKFAIDPNWLPIEAINPKSGSYEGISADILNRIAEVSNIQFEFIPTKTWQESLQLAQENKVDMLLALSITPKRQEFLNFTNKIITLSQGVIMKNDASFITSLEGLKGFRVGVPQGTSLYSMLKEQYPSLILVPTNGVENGLDQLNNDEIDAFVGNLEVASHIIFQKHFFDLKVVHKLEQTRQLHIGAHKNIAHEAITIMNKAIETISEDEMQNIRQRWIGLKIDGQIDYTIFYKIAIGVLLLVIFFVFWNRKLKQLVDKKTLELRKLLQSFDKNVIASTTDLKGNILYASEAFCEISGYSKEELLGKPQSMVRHPDTPKALFEELWKTIESDLVWRGEVKNRRKDGSFYWVDVIITPEYDDKHNKIGYSAIRHDITSKKEVEELSQNLELKVEERTEELKASQEQTESILSSVLLPMLITSKKTRKIVYANSFAANQYETTLDELIGLDIDLLYSQNSRKKELIDLVRSKGSVKNFETEVRTVKGNTFDGLLSLVNISYAGEPCILGVANDITEQKQREIEIKELHKHVTDSIEYASLIQHALIPSQELFGKYFKDYLTIWQPKDVVGGDIYLFEELRNENECLLMVIDCTGHGVPGAFVSMLVKAIQEQITANIINSDDEVSPAEILSIFNKTMKYLLKQEDSTSIANAGFDGGILYYNKAQNIVRFAGAEVALFYVKEQELKSIKGNRHSIGYKKSDANYEFEEHTLDVSSGMQLYITTDGYIDQNGGEKGFPFGKKRFQEIILSHKDNCFDEQKEVFLQQLSEYQQDAERNDDITIVGVKL